jgi:homoserine O-acetyltransferase
MKADCLTFRIEKFTTSKGLFLNEIDLTYELFGKALHTAPVVLINHALTGNSDLTSREKGWWRSVVGDSKLVDTLKYTVIAFNIPGNAYDGFFIMDYWNYTARDVAELFLIALNGLGIESLYAAIGGSLGGGLLWEMAVIAPVFIQYLVPVACHWQANDWIIGFNYVQMQILNGAETQLETARMMAMLFYRTPQSLQEKFGRTRTNDGSLYNVESWLRHHGNKLKNRFDVSAYKMMTHLLTTLDITAGKTSFDEAVNPIRSTIVQIAIDSDLLFMPQQTRNTKQRLDALGICNQYHEIRSVHGHDAFLIEFEQLESFLKPIFK